MQGTIHSRKIRRWRPQSIEETAAGFNPVLRGWINDYGSCYRSLLAPILVGFGCFAASAKGNAVRRRPSARLLVLDPTGCLLLFRFVHKHGALAGRAFWATPGGGLEPGESFAEAATRELQEETGIAVGRVGNPVARREFVMTMPDGEQVVADEQFFVVPVDEPRVLRDRSTALEVEVMADYRWWTAAALRATRETVWPNDLPEILTSAGHW